MSDSPALDAYAYKVLADVLGGNGRVVAYRPYFAHAFGGACNALLLSQFWFWTNTPTVKGRGDGWFWKSQQQITAETGLTRTETKTARRDLRQLGVLEEEVRGCPATVHYRVSKPVLFERLWAHIQANPDERADIVMPSCAVAGYVYLLSDPYGNYKIGKALCPQERHAQIAPKMPFVPTLEHWIRCEDYTGAERMLHERFASRRGHGEWFRLTAEEVADMKAIAAITAAGECRRRRGHRRHGLPEPERAEEKIGGPTKTETGGDG